MDRAAVSAPAAARDVASVVRGAGTSFFWAMRLLPRREREAMYAVYAFCREVDDIADEPAPQDDKLRRLEEWQGMLDELYAGRVPAHPIAAALAAAIAAFDLPRTPFEDILQGMETDARGPVVAPAMAALERYCAQVAGAVGMQSVRIFGCRDSRADDFALATGHALQLTNILRDLAEDAADNRLYLPREALAVAGIEARDAAAALADPRLPAACAWLAARAETRYAEAATLRAAMAAADAASLRPALIMTAVYRRVFDRLSARGFKHAHEPVALGRAEKLWIVLRCVLSGA